MDAYGGGTIGGGGYTAMPMYSTTIAPATMPAYIDPYSQAGLPVLGATSYWDPATPATAPQLFGQFASPTLNALPTTVYTTNIAGLAPASTAATGPMTASPSTMAGGSPSTTAPGPSTALPDSPSASQSAPPVAAQAARPQAPRSAAAQQPEEARARPKPKSVTVKQGDTLNDIARAAGVSASALYELNKGVIGGNPNLIRPGQQLRLS